jgi:hypothetical protein
VDESGRNPEENNKMYKEQKYSSMELFPQKFHNMVKDIFE